MYARTNRNERWVAGGVTILISVLLAAMLLLGTGAQASSIATPAKNAEIHTNDVRARWSDDGWEYSVDNGETWTDEVPEGVTVHEDKSLTLTTDTGDYAPAAWEQGLHSWLASVYEEVDNLINDALPEGHEAWGSFVRFGETVARRTDEGQWEYSTDGGEAWTDEAPEGFSVNESGTMLRFSGNQ